jgi:hypothetical protein
VDAWNLSNAEWESLGGILTGTTPDGGRTGRPRLDTARKIAETCLFRHFHSLAPRSRSFGWNELPREEGFSPATANRRFNEWLESGAWVCFWDALLDRRFGSGRAQEWALPGSGDGQSSLLESPVLAIVADMERAFCFMNARFFGGTLPPNIAITLEAGRGGRLGYFCGGRWRPTSGRKIHHMMLSTEAVSRGKEAALEVLLHEMVHYRNHHVGVVDCSAVQYHNRHFRDAALLAGLDCDERNARGGYSATRLGTRGQQAIEQFQFRDESIFELLRSGSAPTTFAGAN